MYSNFGSKIIDFDSNLEIVKSYNNGFVASRTNYGDITQVRSLRINLKEFQLSSENRRILRKFNHKIKLNPVPFQEYSWEIHKLGKDFYETKFGVGTFSANKIKELFTSANTNFNTILTFINYENNETEGYCIALQASNIIKDSLSVTKILHYAYPFYKLELINSSFGIFMMTKTIVYAKEQNFNYIYLGSVHEKSALYKLQFKGLEWWDETTDKWNEDLSELKQRVGILPTLS